MRETGKIEAYEALRSRFNARPNGADFLFLSRACYGGVIRFRRADGAMSTPCGAHEPISPAAFGRRVDEWHLRFRGAELLCSDYVEVMACPRRGDLVYCDPPYLHSQSIVYGAQSFDLAALLAAIEGARSRGARLALSIDGTKKSGRLICDLPLPRGLFRRELEISVGRSMLRRFQLGGKSLRRELVTDRLLLTW